MEAICSSKELIPFSTAHSVKERSRMELQFMEVLLWLSNEALITMRSNMVSHVVLLFTY
jgi:hypothetical protein